MGLHAAASSFWGGLSAGAWRGLSPTFSNPCLSTGPCPAGFYQSAPANATSDRICSPVTQCNGITNYQSAPPTPTRDTICSNVTQCVQNVTYRSVPPNRTADAVCSPVTTCATNQYVSSAPTPLLDRVCAYPDGSIQCAYAPNYGAPGTVVIDTNSIIMCINQQTSPGLFLAPSCLFSTVASQFPPNNPYLIVLQPTLQISTSCDVSVLNVNGTVVGKVVLQQNYVNVLNPYSPPLTVIDDFTGAQTSTTFSNSSIYPPVMPDVTALPVSLGGIDFRAKPAYYGIVYNSAPSIVETFAPSCNPNATATIVNVALVGDPFNVTTLSVGTADTQTTALATLTGNAVNCRTTPQSSSYQASVTRTRTYSVQDTTSTSHKFSLGTEFKFQVGVPLISQVDVSSACENWRARKRQGCLNAALCFCGSHAFPHTPHSQTGLRVYVDQQPEPNNHRHGDGDDNIHNYRLGAPAVQLHGARVGVDVHRHVGTGRHLHRARAVQQHDTAGHVRRQLCRERRRDDKLSRRSYV